MLSQALQWIKENAVANRFDLGDGPVFDCPVYRAPHPPAPPLPAPLSVQTLAAIAHYLKDNLDGLEPHTFTVHVESPTRVSVVGALSEFHRQRASFLVASTKPGFDQVTDTWLPVEDMILHLASLFVDSEDWRHLVDALKSVKIEGVTIQDDDGISQNVTMKRGTHSATIGTIKTPLLLRPFRTFAEVQQPESPFAVRLRGSEAAGVHVKLLEADGDRWTLEARQSIALFLREHFSELDLEIPILC